MSSPTFIPPVASLWMKMLLSRSRLKIGQLKKEVVKKKTAFAKIDSDLYHVNIADTNKVDLLARMKARTLNAPPPPSKSLNNMFPTGAKADTVHFIVEPKPGLTLGRKRKPSAESLRKRRRCFSVAPISDTTTRRELTVRALYDRLNRHRFVLVRGTPASGKSTLAQLLADYIRSKEPGVNPIMIGSWLQGTIRWSLRVPEMRHDKAPSTFIIDEAQSTYWDSEVWNSVFKPIIAKESPHRAILFAGYESPNGCVTAEGTSTILSDRNVVGFQPVHHGDQITPAGLFLTRSEFADLVERKHPSGPFEQDFLDYVFRVTAGHAGAVTDLLRTVKAHDSYRNIENEDKKYSLEIFHSEFPIENLWSSLDSRTIFGRGLPKRTDLKKPSTARVFRAVLTNNFVTEEMLDSTEDKNALDQCFKFGWLHTTTMNHRIVHIFATPLNRWFVEYHLGARLAEFTPIAGQDLPAFAIEVIRKFSRLNLSSREQIRDLSNQRLPEALDEFYRCCYNYTNGSLFSFPESGAASGKIDLYIPGGKWGVELLYDGDNRASHLSRFTGPGAYAKMEFKDYITLNFCTSSPQKAHPGMTNLYHVVFVNDHSSVRILRGSSLELVAEFELLNA